MVNREDPPTVHSRLMKYKVVICQEDLAELEMVESADEGYSEGEFERLDNSAYQPARYLQNPQKTLEDLTNVAVLSKLPEVPYPYEFFATDILRECEIMSAVVKLSKLPNVLFIYELSGTCQSRLNRFMKRSYPDVAVRLIVAPPPDRYRDDSTEMILRIFARHDRNKMSYEELFEEALSSHLLLTKDFPFDTERLNEINRDGFHGLRSTFTLRRRNLNEHHRMLCISVRQLAPLVHRMIQTEQRHLDQAFLESLEEEIRNSAYDVAELPHVAFAVDGEALKKPLEHLVTCVPGVEVVWTNDKKIIRKLELPERHADLAPRGLASAAATQDPPGRQEQDIVKSLSDILKRPNNLYMSLGELEGQLGQVATRLGHGLRQFITERPKHFQILGEGDFEVVTLSHRAQIKRVCNDLQKVLRPMKPKCISSAQIATAFAQHWRTTNDAEWQNRRFNVEDFGVCFLDDLLLTIPQHWGVNCSEYVSTEGQVIQRKYGTGEEDVPDFVPQSGRKIINAWIPKHVQTEEQKKNLALLKQQILNIFRGDPSADVLINHLRAEPRLHGPENGNRLLRLAGLRANRPTPGGIHHRAEQRSEQLALPCNLLLEEKAFVPLYHRFCGEQVTLANFGVRDLFELFDSMLDTFIIKGVAPNRTITLTQDAKLEILERRVIDVLRKSGHPLTESDLFRLYVSEPTMVPYHNAKEIREAVDKSAFIREILVGQRLMYQVPHFFSYSRAVAGRPDIEHVLMKFMQSYAPLEIVTIEREFTARTGRPLKRVVIEDLKSTGAIRQVTGSEELYDLHDICRVVRNLVFKMNENPTYIYTVESQPYLNANLTPTSVATLLAFSGDYTFIPPRVLLEIMSDFTLSFQQVGEVQFKLQPALQIWTPPVEVVESAQPRRGNRGAQIAPRGRQNYRFSRNPRNNNDRHHQRRHH
ncbi:uncharacterized protein LOC100900179 [Galendromus occidentalis]|uniref:Uncharacterized protein LOC100900179 n=1 Tax=Galendromus occidentalis TaxID=34638 RepID=A0AAJ7L5D8_9ACAR|nr:uncharacterized protein LOC100900179 [Galendromus occidentalis]